MARDTFGSRTCQAAEWPPELNQKVLDAVVQQAEVEACAVKEAQEAYPLERQQASQRRRRPGRASVLTEQYNAPPVYLRPDHFEPVPPDDEADRTLAELVGEESRGRNLRVVSPGDDASHRAIMAEQLEPVLNLSEQDRRRKWLQLRPELRKCLRDLRVNFGHPTNTTLQRILRRQRATPEAIRGVDFLACDSCGQSRRNRRPKPVRLPGHYEFNRHLLIDCMYAKDIRSLSPS